VDWGGRKFSLTLENANTDHVIESLCTYVRRNQPARVEAIQARVRQAMAMPLHEAAVACAKELVEFIYDTVERSRRRSLREMWLAAREGADAPDTEFRRRILDYLTQGDIAPALEALIDREHFEASDWIELLVDIRDPEDARELRGNAGRLLSSYPDHPGLLLARAISEAIDPTGDIRELASNLRMALTSATERYGVAKAAVGRLVEDLLALTAEHRPAASTAVLAVAETMGVFDDEPCDAIEGASRGEPADVGVRILALARMLERSEASLQTILRDRTRTENAR
jgi:ATP-dependent DNA helicase RecQ